MKRAGPELVVCALLLAASAVTPSHDRAPDPGTRPAEGASPAVGSLRHGTGAETAEETATRPGADEPYLRALDAPREIAGVRAPVPTLPSVAPERDGRPGPRDASEGPDPVAPGNDPHPTASPELRRQRDRGRYVATYLMASRAGWTPPRSTAPPSS